MEEFCGSRFWDMDLSWYTDDPDLTPCFENTVLVWIPAGFLWIFATIDILNSAGLSKPRRRSIPFNFFNVAKLIICLLLMLTEIVKLSNSLRLEIAGFVVYAVEKYTPILKLCTYALVLGLGLFSKKNGVPASTIQFTFWFMVMISEFFPFRSAIRENQFLDEKNEYLLLFISHIVYYPLIIGQFLLHCWADTSMSIEDESEDGLKRKNVCPEQKVSPLSKLFFSWFDPLVLKGYKKALEAQDLWELNPEDRSRTIVPLFDKHWAKKMAKNVHQNHYTGKEGKGTKKVMTKKVGILSVLFGAFGATFFTGAILKLVPDLLAFVSPQILNLLIAFTSNDAESWKGYFYAGLLLVSGFAQALFLAHYNHIMYSVTLRVKSALVSAVYRKSILISNSTKKGSTVGEIVNLMSVDVQKVLDVIPYINMVWTSPIQITIALYFLSSEALMGLSVFAGIGIILIIIPINGVIAGFVRKFQMAQMKNKDNRVKLINEILAGIKILKLYAWEPSFQDVVSEIRGKEAKNLKDAYYLNAVNDFLWTCSQFLITIVTFAVYILVDSTHVLDPQKVFVSLSLFNVMTLPLIALPMVIVWAIQAAVSLTRLNKFMNSEEIDFSAVTHDSSETHPIVIEDGNFSWDGEGENGEQTHVLKNINLKVKEGSLVAVVGVVGSGKSSLLAAILGELEKTSGRVNTKGSIGYVAQQAWIQNATLRENILFGKSYEPHKYDKVIDACSLLPDLDILPGRDGIEIGEKGINLSGGQKQRISLARAAYNNADVYLLDDTLSAVDSHVAKHIFEQVLGPNGLLKRKTRVLVTHSITFLPQVDQIVVMKDGVISEVGTYQQLIDKKGEFSDFLAQYLNNGEGVEEMDDDDEDLKPKEDDDDAENPSSKILLSGESGENFEKSNESGGGGGSRRRKFKLQGRGGSVTPRKLSKSAQLVEEEKEGLLDARKLIVEETSETTGVAWTVYFDYFRAASWQRIIPAFIMYFAYQGCAVGSNLWLSVWSNEPIVNGTQANRDLYLGVYAGFGVGQSIAFLLASTLIGLAALRSSSVFHLQMLARILRAPMSFFNSTPTGRIVNRFAKDVDTLDNMLPFLIRTWLIMIMQVLGILVIIVYTTPMFIIAAIPIAIFYYFVQRFYVPTSRQLKRLESVTRSPIYSHFSETISGVATIRAYGQQERFILQSEAKVDANQCCYFPSMVSNRWLSVRMEAAGALIIFFAAIFAVMSRGTLNAGMVGLSISYALQMTYSLTYLVRSVCDVEANIVAVERLKEYGEAPQEAPWKSATRTLPKTWPAYGSIQFKNYETRYRENLDLVLRNVSFQVEPGEKIGIVGRTGAGKSSMTLALFRLIEASGGSISIDGEDIAKIGLHDLRSRITIIPQDPVLFSGTLRFNLDPFGKYSESSLWNSLDSAHLKNFVSELPAQLVHPISEGGENLSVGQRQLVCLARALLRKTKILVLDEATAAVDLETDDLIQATIRQEFKDCTVITIAHRLNTIMDSTRVLVLDNGQIKELDSPENLLKNKNSIFYSMAKDAGLI